MSGKDAVQLLVDIVVKGGNLLLNIAPGPLGQWHDDAYKLLADIGSWMKINGEAIYGTRALAPYKEGKVCISKKGNNTLYIYYMAAENETMPSQIGMTSYSLPAGSKIEMLGTGTFLKWQKNEKGFIVTVPEKIRKLPPSKYVWVMKVTY
jgi:alpha-L-fucosidase